MSNKLLIVDDSATMRKIVIKTIRQADLPVGEDVDEAGNGLEALEKVKSTQYDIIFCDINMPEMNGIEFVREARKLPECAETLIVMITTESADETIQSVKADGANAYVTKPFTPEKLKQEVRPLMATA